MFTPSEKAKTWFLGVHNSCETGYQPALSRIGRPSGKKWIIGGLFKEIKRQGDKSKMNTVLKNFQWKCSFFYPFLSICFFGFPFLQNPFFNLVDTKTHIASPNIYPDKKKLHFQGFWANTSFLLSAPPLLRSLRKKDLLGRISNFKRRQSFFIWKRKFLCIFFLMLEFLTIYSPPRPSHSNLDFPKNNASPFHILPLIHQAMPGCRLGRPSRPSRPSRCRMD